MYYTFRTNYIETEDMLTAREIAISSAKAGTGVRVG